MARFALAPPSSTHSATVRSPSTRLIPWITLSSTRRTSRTRLVCSLPNTNLAYPTLTHLADVQILREGIKLCRKIGETEPLKESMSEETWPGPDVQSDAEWEEFLRGSAFTEYHPSSTCSMLPLEQGGVVDAHLRVYGLANVRVADASVPPIAFSAHLMGSTYGIAEHASTIIRSFHNRVIPKANSTTLRNSTSATTGKNSTKDSSPTQSTSTSSTGSAASGSSNDTNGVALLHPSTLCFAGVLSMAFTFLL